ncbi:MAG TPA: hypothetical protein VF745_02890 [Steroidobacteraceae bacterium]
MGSIPITRSSQGGPPQFLRTHPSSQNRMQKLEQLVPKVMPLYESARKGA